MEGRIPTCQGNLEAILEMRAQISVALSGAREEMRGQHAAAHKSSVLKSVLRKYEAGETCEIGEIFRCVFSITYVFSTG